MSNTHHTPLNQRRGVSLLTILVAVVMLVFIAAAVWQFFDRERRQRDALQHEQQQVAAQIAAVETGEENRIWLEGTRGTDELLDQINGLEDLKTLRLERTDLTNAGLGKLTNLPGLKVLIVTYAAIDNDGLKQLATNLPDLDTLVLIHTEAAGSGFSSLQPLEHLKYLAIDGRAEYLNDAALAPLAKMPQLRTLQLGPRLFSAAAVRHLRKVLPHCAILIGDFSSENWP